MQLCSLAPSLLTLSLSALPAWSQTTWTVDDDGPADFASLATAVDSVGSNDTLLIQPGDYGDVTITQRINLLGDPDKPAPQIDDLVIDGASRFSMSHMGMRSLVVSNVAGRSEIDDCQIDGFRLSGLLRIENAAELVVQGTAVDVESASTDGGIGAVVMGNSRVVFSDCAIHGGDAYSNGFFHISGWGGDGLRVLDESQVTLAGCDVTGGNGEYFYIALGSYDPGRGGDALATFGLAEVDVRGSSNHILAGGIGDAFPLFGSSDDGFAMSIFGFSEVLYSGITLQGFGDLFATEVVPPAAYQFVRGPGALGGFKRLFLHGPAGAPAITFASTSSSLLDLPILGGIEIWIDPNQIAEALPFVLQGQDTAVNWVWETPMDPSLAGFSYELQSAVLEPGSGAFSGTNPAFILLSF